MAGKFSVIRMLNEGKNNMKNAKLKVIALLKDRNYPPSEIGPATTDLSH